MVPSTSIDGRTANVESLIVADKMLNQKKCLDCQYDYFMLEVTNTCGEIHSQHYR